MKGHEMRFTLFKYLFLTVSSLLLSSRMMPAQTTLPALPMDSRIQKGTLGSGITYYMVTDPAVKGYAQVAIVQRDEPLSSAKRETLDAGFLSRMSIAPGPEGYLSDVDGSTIYHFNHVPFYRPEVLDSTLLYSFALVARSKAEQAVIVSGDIDAPELKKKMDIFSMMVPRMLVKENHRPDYVWEPSPAPSVQFYPGSPARVSVTYAGSRIPFAYMNTAQALVTDLFGAEFQILLQHRLERTLREAGIPYGDIRFSSLRSGDYGGDERYSVSVTVAPAQLNAAMRVISATLAEMDTFGVKADEFADAKAVLQPALRQRAAEIPSPGSYVNRCIAHFLYGANLAPFSETLYLFNRKNVADSTETRLFNRFSGALLEQLSNLTLEYTGVPDSLNRDDELFYYNLSYLYGSINVTGTDYSWRPADTLGLSFSCPKVRIKNEKKEVVSGALLWTVSNGMRVVYKQVPGSGMFHYALQLNGGLCQIDGLREGEGGYIGDMLSLYDAGGLPAWHFREVLAVNGITMDAHAGLHSLGIRGSAPTLQFPLVLKALLALANTREPNAAEFELFRQRESLRSPETADRLKSLLAPGYVYSETKDPSVLSADTWKKAEQYYDERFSHLQDGVLIISGDLQTEVVKKMLCKYLGGFKVLKGSAARKPVDYSPLSGAMSYTEEGPAPGIHILAEAAYALTADHFYTSLVAAEALEKQLVQRLAAYGFGCKVSVTRMAHPQERFRLWISCQPLPLANVPAAVEEVSAQRALTVIRAVLAEASRTGVDGRDLALWKTKLGGEVQQGISSAAGFTEIQQVRYAQNKDLVSQHKESINGITEAKVKEFLQVMADGGRVELTIP